MDEKINFNIDVSNMKDAIKSFPNQIRESFAIMKNWSSINEYDNIQNILILGMGGSAIGGDLVKVMAQNSCSIPIIINRSYSIPEWVDDKTLVMASSYSGNTEETLSAFKKCHEKKSPILILSTGGILSNYASELHLDKIVMPKGLQPRAALGFSFTLIALTLKYFNFISGDIIDEIKKTIDILEQLKFDIPDSSNFALQIAKEIYGTCPIIYGSEDMGWLVALRLKGQLAENAKILSFHNHFPEQNHNEIEGWTKNEHIMKNFSVIWIKDEEDHDGIKLRMEISSELIKPVSSKHIYIYQSGENRIERLIKMIYCVDWISYYLALLNEVDPTPVNRIQELKSKVALHD